MEIGNYGGEVWWGSMDGKYSVKVWLLLCNYVTMSLCQTFLKLIFLRDQNFSHKKVFKKSNDMFKHEEKTVKEVKMHTFLVFAQDFAKNQEHVVRSHDSETVTFRNSALYNYKLTTF